MTWVWGLLLLILWVCGKPQPPGRGRAFWREP